MGWNRGGTNLHFGGLDGYSSENSRVTLYTPPDQSVPSVLVVVIVIVDDDVVVFEGGKKVEG